MSEALIDLAWIVYLIDVLAVDRYSFLVFLCWFLGLSGLVFVCFVPVDRESNDSGDVAWRENQPTLKKLSKVLLTIGVFYQCYYIFMPSKDTAWTITGIVAAAKVAENPEINKVTGKGMDILNKKLELYSKKLDKELGIEGDK